MNRIEKFLVKLSLKERKVVKEILVKIESGSYKNLDIKKLKGNSNIFRVRKGSIRIIFVASDQIRILSIGRRGDTTYN